MKTKPLIVALTILFAFGLFVSNGFAQLFGGGSDENISAELKKLNTRLVEKLFPAVNGLKNKQDDLAQKMAALNNNLLNQQKKLVQQVELLNNSLASLQGSIEQNQVMNQKANAKLDNDINQVKSQMASLESQVTNELKTQFTSQIKTLNEQADKQKAEQQAFRQSLTTRFDDLRKGVAQDMDRLGQQTSNVIQDGLSKQSQRIDEAILTVGDLAKLETQNAQLLTSGVQTLKKNDQDMSATLKRVESGQSSMHEKNEKLIDILSQTLTQQQNALMKIDQLVGRQQNTKEDVELTRETIKALKDIVDKRLAETSQAQEAIRNQNQQVLQQTEVIQKNLLVSDEKMNKLASGLKTLDALNSGTQKQLEAAHQKLDQVKSLSQQTDEKFARLVDTTKSMLTSTSKVGDKMDQVVQKIDAGRTEANISNEKLSRLVEILKAIASEQEKFDQVLGNQNMINKNVQTAASDIQKNLSETHKEFRDRLEDLRRKSNVAIARNNDILKVLQK